MPQPEVQEIKNKKLSAFLSTGIARPPKGFCLCRGGSTRLSPQDCARPWQLQTLIFCSNLPTYPLFSEVMEKDFPCRVPMSLLSSPLWFLLAPEPQHSFCRVHASHMGHSYYSSPWRKQWGVNSNGSRTAFGVVHSGSQLLFCNGTWCKRMRNVHRCQVKQQKKLPLPKHWGGPGIQTFPWHVIHSDPDKAYPGLHVYCTLSFSSYPDLTPLTILPNSMRGGSSHAAPAEAVHRFLLFGCTLLFVSWFIPTTKFFKMNDKWVFACCSSRKYRKILFIW